MFGKRCNVAVSEHVDCVELGFEYKIHLNFDNIVYSKV